VVTRDQILITIRKAINSCSCPIKQLGRFFEELEGIFREKGIFGHAKRTQKYMTILYDEMMRDGVYPAEMSEFIRERLALSVALHDIGKIETPDEILNKREVLTKHEKNIIKNHTKFWENWLHESYRPEELDFLKRTVQIAESHHEKWDGTGGPKGLKGSEIPLAGRMATVVDVYDALTSTRTYKGHFTHKEACERIKADSGTYFDPAVVEIFIKNNEKFKDAHVSFLRNIHLSQLAPHECRVL